MGLTSLQVCMDSSDHWLQGTINEESGMDSFFTIWDMLTLFEALDGEEAQACRRYWTKGGTLRNIPVGGGCRKNKKVSKKSNDQSVNQMNPGSSSSHNPTDLHLSFPELEALAGSSRNYDFMGNGDLSMVSGLGDMSHHHGLAPNYGGLCLHLGPPLMETVALSWRLCQRLMLPHGQGNNDQHGIDVKPNTKLLSLDWQDQGCSDGGKDTSRIPKQFRIMDRHDHGYGSSTTNTLV
ncbi:DOF ZINC FINGER PROTEIN DOF1.4-RELATED [Salix viminalis]|uniref:DOF ZINC FINGER PROTEIN DOF1.4-RELATED n=1 Tax=Salix viminalis TaxID=40686 RepID=A0A9Q0SD26_SALVM|nr:DOF ZINC FINGER PROTEIN DOF1.4-RELATED [Salix viminalis]